MRGNDAVAGSLFSYPALFTIPCAWLIVCLHFLPRQIADAASLPDCLSGFVLRIAGFVG